MDITQTIFGLIANDDIPAITSLLDEHPGLVHARGTHPDDRRSALGFAAGHGKLEVCRLLVDRGAEVYPNPMNQYPPVVEAAWKKHQHVVDYFLKEIPHLADGTNGLGVTINLAGRQGWADIVEKHLEHDRLAVHYVAGLAILRCTGPHTTTMQKSSPC